MIKYIFIILFGVLLNAESCKTTGIEPVSSDFLEKKIAELEAKPVYNPPASIWKWVYQDSTYFYVTADCCDQFNELYTAGGELLCHPDGGFTGRGDGKCPVDFSSLDSAQLTKTLIWRDDRGKSP